MEKLRVRAVNHKGEAEYVTYVDYPNIAKAVAKQFASSGYQVYIERSDWVIMETVTPESRSSSDY